MRNTTGCSPVTDIIRASCIRVSGHVAYLVSFPDHRYVLAHTADRRSRIVEMKARLGCTCWQSLLMTLMLNLVLFLLWLPCIADADIIFLSCFFLLFLFLASSRPAQSGRLQYFHTWCGLSANLECMFETCCTRLA